VLARPTLAPHRKGGPGEEDEGYADDLDPLANPWLDVFRKVGGHKGRPRGFWLVTHSNHITVGQRSTDPSGSGQWAPPVISFTYPETYQDVVTVSPRYRDGGVRVPAN
jgi:hypothetical protein